MVRENISSESDASKPAAPVHFFFEKQHPVRVVPAAPSAADPVRSWENMRGDHFPLARNMRDAYYDASVTRESRSSRAER